MKERQIHTAYRVIVRLFILVILFQAGVESPVICFESNGQINIEAKCDSTCEIPIQETDEHQDDCANCFDVKLWNYNPDVVLIVRNTSDSEVIPPVSTLLWFTEKELQNKNQFSKKQNFFQKIPPLIQTTILLI